MALPSAIRMAPRRNREQGGRVRVRYATGSGSADVLLTCGPCAERVGAFACRMRSILALLLVFTTVHAVPAQRADSAATARRLMRGAAAVLQRGDTTAAADSVLAAARAWPAQSSYWLAAARWNAVAHRPEVALDALTTLVALGAGWQRDDPRLASLAREARYAALQPPSAEVRSRVVVTLPDADFHPEGVAWDARSKRLFVGSVHRGSVVVIGADSTVTTFVPAGTAGMRAVLGVLADTARNLLFVSSADVPERDGGVASPRAASSVLAFSLTSGALVRQWGFPEDGHQHLIGELVLAPDGTVWGTDSEHPALYRVPMSAAAARLEPLAFSHRDWVSLQGLAFSADGQQAWIADWTTGLYHLDLVRGVVTPVAAPSGGTLLGIDGQYRRGPGQLIGIQNGIAPHRIVALELDAGGMAVRALRPLDHPPGEGEPTLGVLTPEGLLFVAGSLWPFYDGAGRLGPAEGRPRGEIRRISWQ